MNNSLNYKNEEGLKFDTVSSIIISELDDTKYKKKVQILVKSIKAPGNIIDLTNTSDQDEVYTKVGNIQTYMELHTKHILYKYTHVANICENLDNVSVVCLDCTNIIMYDLQNFHDIALKYKVDIVLFNKGNTCISGNFKDLNRIEFISGSSLLLCMSNTIIGVDETDKGLYLYTMKQKRGSI